ncbi:hypothetical protein CGC58_04555 [Capnocytophaga stomatis]|uniref:Flippase n=1 Tax=Capnocytophaga stomatis TaxID=1848904 RepID=A0A250FV49_9FLAO|nr:flippase [Capnocytophaga stomatis]ATA89049.1 hypothetical protein CGC58_04555 [Capnocytophaga stomatis]
MLSDKILRKNFSYLLILQIAQYLIPLVLLPYLGRTLESENLGKIMFVQAFVGYFILIVDFGFNVSATKEIADSSKDKNRISGVFWNTMLAKFSLLILSLLLFVVIVFSFDRFRQEYILFLIGFIGVFSSLLFPLWLFQGMEKIESITVANVVPRIVMLLLTFYFVTEKTDYYVALLIQMLALLASALLSLMIIIKNRLVHFVKPTFYEAKKQLLSGAHVFAMSISTNLYTTTNVVVLGLLTNDSVVGIYSAADKLIRALISLLSSVIQVIFPRMNIYFLESKQKSINFIRKVIYFMFGVGIALGIVLYFGSEQIIHLMYGTDKFHQAIYVLKYSALLPLFSVINGIIAINIFITFGMKKDLLKVVMVGCMFSLLCISPLILIFEEMGVVLCATFTELIIFMLLIFICKKQQIFLFPKIK